MTRPFSWIRYFVLPAICFAGCCSCVTAQSTNSSFFINSSIGVSGFYGSYFTTQPKAEYIRDSYSYFGEIYFEKQTSGTARWQLSHHFPSWGISYIHGNTGSKQYIGNMNALYAFLNIPMIKARNYKTSFRVGSGTGWVQKPYNIYTNPKNTLIGTRFNAYISLLLQNEIKILPKTFFSIAVGFTHLSNGGTTLPNLGLNTPVLTAGLRYAFHDPVFENKPLTDSFKRKVQYHISLSAAEKQIQLVGGPYNVIFVLQPQIIHHFSANQAYGYGMTFFLNPDAERDKHKYHIESESTSGMQAGVFGAYTHFFGKLSLPLQIGAYVFNRGKSPPLFQQIGLDYLLTHKLNAQLYLKTHLGKADFIHAGLGYTF